jgi:predicted MFS family arabinose efflux permease
MEVVSGIGDGVFWVGLAAVLLHRDAGAEGFTIAALARLGPRAIISAPAGVLADRVDRRRLLVGLDVSRMLLMVLLTVAAATDAPLALMFALIFVSYTFAAPYRPALTAALPLVAGESGLASANALVSTVRQLMTFIGPLIGAVVLRLWSPAIAFAINATSFLVAATLVTSVKALGGYHGRSDRSLSSHRSSWAHEVAEGWREIAAVPGLSVVAVLVFVMYVARGAELVLFVLLADQRLGLGAAGVGVLTGSVGLGALLVLPLARRVSNTRWPALMISLSVAASAVPFAAFAAIRSTALACVVLVVLGAGVVVFELMSVVLLQRLARRETLGRVFGLVGTVSNAGKLTGALAAPAVASSLGIAHAMTASGITVALLGAMAVPGLVRLARTTRARQDQLRPITDVLAALAVFEHAPQPALERLAAAVEPVRLDAGAVAIQQGEQADDLYVIREGTCTVFDGQRQINALAAGDWFGEIGLLQHRPRTATVVVDAGGALLWRIPGTTFLDALQESASAPMALVEVMADRLARSAT